MKTDDDAFVRVDEILSSLHQVNISHGLLYGRVNADSHPHRDPYSKWYITPEVTCFELFFFNITRMCKRRWAQGYSLFLWRKLVFSIIFIYHVVDA